MDRPIRVLHILGSLDRGGAETWLLHALRHTDRSQTAMDFLVHRPEKGAYEEEVLALGARVHRCLEPRNFWRYARTLKSILTEQGPYDVVHSHVHHFSGHVLHVARRCGVPARIAHSHNDTSHLDDKAGLLRRGYLALMRHWIARDANVGLAASGKAADSLFGSQWQRDPRRRILYCGVDLRPFSEPVDRDAVRMEFGWTSEQFVVGHVGRFDEQKNHPYLIKIFSEIAQRHADARLLLVGTGATQTETRQLVTDAGLGDRVAFAGTRPDVPRLLSGAMDVFVMPSWYEGLPLVLVEAQAAGLPCFISDVIAPETTLVEPLIHKLSLSDSPAEWAKVILAQARDATNCRSNARTIVERSPLNIVNSSRELQDVYREFTPGAKRA